MRTAFIGVEAVKFVFLYFLCYIHFFFIVGFKIMRIDLYLIFEIMEIMSHEQKKEFFFFVSFIPLT